MGLWTNLGRTVRGADFFRNRLSIWIGLGRTTPWADEAIPPSEDATSRVVDELFGLKLYSEVGLAVLDEEDGTIIFMGHRYRKLTIEEGFEIAAPFLYLKFVIEPEEFAGRDYRQVGVFVDLIPAEGFHSFRALLPTQARNLGQLVFFSNDVLQIRHPNTRHEIFLVLPQ